MSIIKGKRKETVQRTDNTPQQFGDISMILSYEGISKILPGLPRSIKEMHQQMNTLFGIKTPELFRLFMIDHQGDKIEIYKNRDLKLAYKTTLSCDQNSMKIFVWRRDAPGPNINSFAHLNQKKGGWNFAALTNSFETDSKRGLDLKPIVTRNLHRYYLHCKYKNYVYYKGENQSNLNGEGIWRINLESDSDCGESFKKHSARFEDHTYTMEVLHQSRLLEDQISSFREDHSLSISIPIQYQFQNISALRPDEVRALNDIKTSTIKIINDNPNINRNDFIAFLTKNPNFFNIMQTQLAIVDHLFADCQKQIQLFKKKESHFEELKNKLPDISKVISPIFSLIPLSFDVRKVKNNNNMQFGRYANAVLNKGTGTVNGFVSFVSDYGIGFLKAGKEAKEGNFLINMQEIEIGAQKLKHLMTFMIRTGKEFRPFLYVLGSNFLEDTLERVFDWIKDELGEFFTPKSITTDINPIFTKVINRKFSDGQVYVSHHRFAFDLWKMADNLELVDRFATNQDLVDLIEDLKLLPYQDIEEAKKKYAELKSEHCSKPTYNKTMISEFFHEFNERYLVEEVMKFLNNHKITEDTDLFLGVNSASEQITKLLRRKTRIILSNPNPNPLISRIQESVNFLKSIEHEYQSSKIQFTKITFNESMNKVGPKLISYAREGYISALKDKTVTYPVKLKTKEEVHPQIKVQ